MKLRSRENAAMTFCVFSPPAAGGMADCNGCGPGRFTAVVPLPLDRSVVSLRINMMEAVRTESRYRFIPFASLLFFAALTGCPPQSGPAGPIAYVSPQELASKLGLRIADSSSAHLTLTNGIDNVTIFPGLTGRIYINGKPYGTPNKAISQNGQVYTMAPAIEMIRLELRRLADSRTGGKPPPPAPRPPRSGRCNATIVVDAGHGGTDPGTRSVTGTAEKTIVFDIATRLAASLSPRCGRVIMTRTTDRKIDLEERAAIAERTRCDLFVSIHADWAERRSASGATLYISRNSSNTSYAIARSIHAALVRNGIESNGIQRAGFIVLKNHSRPAVLVETGFASNWSDARKLDSAAFRAKIAEAIADGIVEYFAK